MKEDKAKANSQPASPLPSWPEEQELSEWAECSQVDLFAFGDLEGCKELSDWEESILQALSEGEDSVASQGNGDRPSVQSSWEDDGDQELSQDNQENVSTQSLGVKGLLREEDEWEELSVLELCEEEEREQRLGCFAEDGLPVPVLQEAWLEQQAFEPCPQAPFCACFPHSPVRALHRRCSPSAPQLPAKAPPGKRPSRVKRALGLLGRLFCCPWPVRVPQPED